jgi:hypothetical protein
MIVTSLRSSPQFRLAMVKAPEPKNAGFCALGQKGASHDQIASCSKTKFHQRFNRVSPAAFALEKVETKSEFLALTHIPGQK